MGIRGIGVWGRLTRVQVLALAVLAVSVGLLLANAKPAHAAGETLYGTIEWSANGQRKQGDGSVLTERSVVRWEAPQDARNARVIVNHYSRYEYQSPEPNYPCYVAEITYSAVGTTEGSFGITKGGNGRPAAVDLWSYPAIPGSTTTRYAGPSCGSQTTFHGTFNYEPFNPQVGSVNSGSPDFWIRRGAGTATRWCGSYDAYGTPAVPSQGCIEDPYWGSQGSPPPYAQWAVPFELRYSIAMDPCSGYTKKWDIGKSDTLVLFNTCQTKSLSARTSWLDDITGKPKVCEVNFIKRLSQLCTAYKAVRAAEWAGNDWFMYNAATLYGHCGLWVVDEASWRPPKIRAAAYGPGSQYVGNMVSIAPGKTEYVKTATGSIPVTCPG